MMSFLSVINVTTKVLFLTLESCKKCARSKSMPRLHYRNNWQTSKAEIKLQLFVLPTAIFLPLHSYSHCLALNSSRLKMIHNINPWFLQLFMLSWTGCCSIMQSTKKWSLAESIKHVYVTVHYVHSSSISV